MTYLRTVFLAILSLLIYVPAANAETFTAYLTGAQEVPPVATNARGYARVFLNEAAGAISFTVVFNGLTGNQTLAHIHGPAPIGTNAGVAINLGSVGGASGTITGNAAITPTQITQLRSNRLYVNIHSSSFGDGELRGQLALKRPVDYDGDGRTDLAVMRFPNVPAPGVAQITQWNLNSTTGVYAANWGDANRDFPAPGDYDGDGRDDVAVYRTEPAVGSQSVFFILRSSDGTADGVAYGVNGDQVVARDYDGDGRTDPAVFRRGAAPGAQAHWWIKRSTTGTDLVIPWGTTGNNTTTFDTPVPADYDGDGRIDVGVYRFGLQPNNTYIILRSSDLGVRYHAWGDFQTDWVVPGDYDGDGIADFCAVRTGAQGSSPMVWWIRNSSTGQARIITFGLSSDMPAQGDYDGDGRTDLAIFRAGATAGSHNFYWILQSLDNSVIAPAWGVRGDFPVNRFDTR